MTNTPQICTCQTVADANCPFHNSTLERELNEAEIYKTCAKASLGQLRKELVESKGWVKAATESVAIASATIARLKSERDQLKEQHQVALNMYERCLIVQHQYEAERDQLKDDLAMAEVRHAAVMMHTQSVVDENTQLRKVCDWFATSVVNRDLHGDKPAIAHYNSLPHVIERNKTK